MTKYDLLLGPSTLTRLLAGLLEAALLRSGATPDQIEEVFSLPRSLDPSIDELRWQAEQEGVAERVLTESLGSEDVGP